MHVSGSDEERLPVTGRLKSLSFTITVIAAFTLGVYSLILAFAKVGDVAPVGTEGLVRTATAADSEMIATAIGNSSEPELVYVVVDAPLRPQNPEIRRATQRAARILLDSGLVISVRHLEPIDPDYAVIVEQNSISQFPAVLMAKRSGGIILITEDLSSENLIDAYQTVWGKKSDCGSDKNAVY